MILKYLWPCFRLPHSWDARHRAPAGSACFPTAVLSLKHAYVIELHVRHGIFECFFFHVCLGSVSFATVVVVCLLCFVFVTVEVFGCDCLTLLKLCYEEVATAVVVLRGVDSQYPRASI